MGFRQREQHCNLGTANQHRWLLINRVLSSRLLCHVPGDSQETEEPLWWLDLPDKLNCCVSLSGRFNHPRLRFLYLRSGNKAPGRRAREGLVVVQFSGQRCAGCHMPSVCRPHQNGGRGVRRTRCLSVQKQQVTIL